MPYHALIQPQELLSCLKDDNILIFDCRFDLSDVNKGLNAYQNSHIPGAFYAHLDEHLSSPITAETGRHPLPDMQRLNEWLASCGMQSEKQVVVYDDSGGAMAVRLWWLLKCLGHEVVAVLDGGWPMWEKLGIEFDSQIPSAVNSAFQAEFIQQTVVSTEDVLNNLKKPDFQLVDVRASERFKGIKEPIDPVAGHIPGAANIPLTDNLDQRGCFKSAEQLRDLYAPLLQQYAPDQQVYMCGSGVTACHSLLALVIAGFDMPRLYAGSWSEWIRDSQRAVATTEG